MSSIDWPPPLLALISVLAAQSLLSEISGASGVLQADDVMAGIDVMHFAGDTARQMRKQIQRAVGDFHKAWRYTSTPPGYSPNQPGLTLFAAGRDDRNRRANWVLCWVRRSRRTKQKIWCQ
jgi:hypothetical protein